GSAGGRTWERGWPSWRTARSWPRPGRSSPTWHAEGGGAAGSAMVRLAGPSDAASVARVHVRSWRATYEGLLPAEYLAALDVDDYAGRWERSLQSPFARGTIVVAEQDGQVVGFASGGPVRYGIPRCECEPYPLYRLPAIPDHALRHGLPTDASD